MPLENPNGVATIARGENRKTGALQNRARQIAHTGFVVHHQNRSATPPYPSRGLCHAHLRFLVRAGKQQPERGAQARLAGHFEPAAMRPHDAGRRALKVTSQPGLGSTFRLLFPGTDKKAEVRLAEPAGRVWRGRGTVLVVDDESGVRDLARAILENSGFTVLTACDGGDAIRIFRRHAGEVVAIVLDLTMPAMTGEEAATELQRIRAGVPIILSSGYSEQEVAGRFAGKGLAGFLQKPYEPAALTEALLRALEQRVAG